MSITLDFIRNEIEKQTYEISLHADDERIADGLVLEGVSVKMLDLRVNHRSDIMTEVLDAKAVILGSPTFNKLISYSFS